MRGMKFIKGKIDTENAKVRKREGIKFVKGNIDTDERYCLSMEARGY